jgi:hypothetical protein
VGYFPYRTAGGLASLLDALAEQPSPDQAANRAEVILTIKHRFLNMLIYSLLLIGAPVN